MAEKLDFKIQVDGNRGSLVLGARRFFGFLDVEGLELGVPGLKFPLQITGGIKQLKNEATHVKRANLTVTQDGLDALVQARESRLSSAGFAGTRVRLADGYAHAHAEVRIGDHIADFSCRVAMEPKRTGLQLILADSNVYGFVERPGSLVLYDFCCALLGRDADLPLAARLSMGTCITSPLSRFFAEAFPPTQWRIPDVSATHIVVKECTPERLRIEYGPREAPAPVTFLPTRVHTYLRHRAAAEALVRGDLDTAVEVYEAMGQEQPGRAVFVARRLLEILTARQSTHDRAEQLAARSLERWPTFLPGHLALAATACARGDGPQAAHHFEHVQHLATHAGHHEAAACSATAAARASNGR